MSEPLTPHQVESKLRAVVNMMEAKAEEYERLSLIAAEAEHAYRLAKAQALVEQDGGTVAERESRALLQVDRERLTAKVSGAERDACKERLRGLHSEVTALVTLSKSVREMTA